ncbi:hypothetical protein XarjCFBP7645_19450 [Xanthomonas arboricola]|uniref:Uncharacterized protein n=1 Tax=Xanthomonas arboricola TaxID=56448 RepID=A0A2S7ABV4_9XANT|nr:hypothetical protein XarjCFBP7645_19450 [Xanthomonas arboricola]
MRQRPWGNDASAYRTPCPPCPVRHTQCDARMTDYAALKLTEMFVGVERLPQRVRSRSPGRGGDRRRRAASAFRTWRASRTWATSR